MNARPEKCRKPMNYYEPQSTPLPQSTQDQNAAYDPRYAQDSPSDNEFKVSDDRDSNESISAGETSANPDGNIVSIFTKNVHFVLKNQSDFFSNRHRMWIIMNIEKLQQI